MGPQELLEEYVEYAGWCTHTVGLTKGWVKRLMTKRKGLDGSHCIVVYYDRVAFCGIRIPYNFTEWMTLEVRHYNTVDELRAAIEEFKEPRKAGCWN